MKVWLLQYAHFWDDMPKTVGIFSSIELLQATMRAVIRKAFADLRSEHYGAFDEAEITFDIDENTCGGFYRRRPCTSGMSAVIDLYAEAHEIDAVCSDFLAPH